jgi:photosystem II stability/assembly factor-like uncharacterized protein
MKKLYCLVAVSIVLFYSSLNAQWIKTGFNSTGVTSIVSKEGNLFVSTWGSAIYGSTDGGATWTADTDGLGYWFYTSYVYALAVVRSSDNSGATNLFAGMEEGGIWRSSNDGASWTWVYPLGKLGEHDMNFVALGSAGSTILAGVAQTGLNGVYRSVNDGGTWTVCNAGFQTAADSNVRCFTSITVGSSTYFYVGTDGGLFISTSDGTSWTRISSGLPSGTITAVVATPPSGGNTDINLFVGVGYSGLYHSTDNGSSWTAAMNGLPTTGTPYIDALVASPVPSGTTSNIFASNGNVYVSTNNGAMWWNTDWPLSIASTAVCFGINGDILLGGGYGIWKYSTAFDSDWVVQQSGTSDTLWSVKAVDNNVVWVGGTNGGIFRSTNGGSAWTSVGGGIIGSDIVYAIEALDANTAFASTTTIGQSGPSSTRIFKTTNGGGSWSQVFSQTNGLIGGIQMQSTLQGYAMGSPVNEKWTILKTTDAGTTWNHLATEPAQVGTESGLLSFQLLGNTLWFGSSSGAVYRSTDLGATWNSFPTSGSYPLGLHFNSPTIGLTGFASGGTNSSTTGGFSWDSAASTGTNSVSCISGLGSEFWATTGTGIAYSNNLGQKWTFTSPGHWGLITLNAVSMSPVTSQVNGWAVGASGLILHYRRNTSSVSQTLSTLPAMFSLGQNYPNPFNPATTINYSLPKAGNVKLTVYNTVGSKVATIVNEYKPAGSYSVKFNGTNLASGIYLYRLESGNYSAAKKFILMK